ncbi:MAG: acetate--CoA ligase [Bdellovibrionaceae bacterium]|nr:acetate--CoA ligase [Pseudobdellovibrionaceae bacterium]
MEQTIAVKKNILEKTDMNWDQYEKQYRQSIEKPDDFWAAQAERITWFKKWNKVKETSFNKPVSIKWFLGGELNVSYNCIDRHLEKNADKVALIWEPDNPKTASRKITYKQLSVSVNRFANVLKNQGVKKGDRVTIYMPMIPETVFAMLACARIGAIHSVVFGGFAADSIKDRIIDAESHFFITADEGYRGGKTIPLKSNVDAALEKTNLIKKVLVVRHTGNNVTMKNGRDVWFHDEVTKVSDVCEPERMNSEDPLFLLYTSGSTGKPKGVLHTTGGYLVYTSLTYKYVFDMKDNDVYWCTADVGWVTGHSYSVYGPLSNGATSVIFEGIPSYPNSSRFWDVIDKHQVSIFYTAPTALRALMREGEEPLKSTKRTSLRILGSVGEPINPEAWLWYYKYVGHEQCPVIDTWWQTETGGVLISPLPGATPLKPGSATLPFFGVQPKILSPEGIELTGECEGVLVLADSWPGQMRTVYRDHERFEDTYFSAYKGYYFTGDGCRRDKDGYYWITGRVDDVLNVSGHRIGTAEVESALVGHSGVSEAAVVGYPHDIKGQGIYVYVTLKVGVVPSEEIKKELNQWVRKEIGPIASLDLIQWAPGLPKTRSGKIMRRILRKIAENEIDKLGDISTLADPSVVDDLVKNRLNGKK